MPHRQIRHCTEYRSLPVVCYNAAKKANSYTKKNNYNKKKKYKWKLIQMTKLKYINILFINNLF